MDSVGERNFSIGHQIKLGDKEHDAVVYPVMPARVLEVFDRDAEIHVDGECYRLYPAFDCLPDFVQMVVGDMMFNMGYTRWACKPRVYDPVEELGENCQGPNCAYEELYRHNLYLTIFTQFLLGLIASQVR